MFGKVLILAAWADISTAACIRGSCDGPPLVNALGKLEPMTWWCMFSDFRLGPVYSEG
uniref:Secreted protein n=1 Tax=Rhizophora mucronata TaxID=61149 RepID=A0A2P2KHN0_RHIMU